MSTSALALRRAVTRVDRLHYQKVALIFFFGISGFLFTNMVTRLPAIQAIHGLDHSATGLLLLMTGIGAMIAMPFTGWLIGRVGSKPIATIAAISLAFALTMICFATHPIVLKGVFLLMGMSSGSLNVSINAQAVDVEKGFNRPIMSTLHAMFSAGMMIGAIYSAVFTGLGLSLIAQFATSAVLSIAMVVLLTPGLGDTVEPKSKPSMKFRVPDKTLLGIGIIAFCSMLAEGAIADWSTSYMREIVSAPAGIAPIALGVFAFAMMTSRLLGDKVRMHIGDPSLVVIAGLIASTGMLLFLAIPSTITSVVGLLLLGTGMSVIVPIVFSTAGRIGGSNAGAAIGTVSTIGYTGLLMGPPLIGYLADLTNLRYALGFVLMLLILMVLLSYVQKRRSVAR